MPDSQQQKLANSLVTDARSRQNFDVVNKNFTTLFQQLQAQNYQISLSCDSFSTAVKYPTTLVNPTNLHVTITASGKKPIMVFLRQKSDAVSTGVYTAGGVFLQNTNGSSGNGVFFINRGITPIFGTVLGGGISGFTPSGTPTWLSYISPSQIVAFDVEAPAGELTYYLQTAVYNTSGTSCSVNFTTVELVAKELF